MYRGAFGTWFSLQNTLQRAAPLLLTALCVALPAQLGLVVIGGEGALVLGGLVRPPSAPPLIGVPSWLLLGLMALAGMAAGGAWIALAGALRQFRGVNETISSLLLAYIAIALMNHLVEGPLARSGQPQQALHPAARRGQHARLDPRPGRPLGAGVRR